MKQKLNTAARLMAVILALLTAACGKATHSSAALISERETKITAETYLSGPNFCQTYDSVTSKEVGLRVDVPLHYTDETQGSLSLYAYTLRPFDPKKPSYIFVDGGPGQNTHGVIPEFFAGAVNEIRFDQRGLGCSSPETFALYKDASLYSSEATIGDIEAIRKAYGIKTWTVYGVSYGTVPATMYASRYQAATKAVVLEGVLGDVTTLSSRDYEAEKLNLILTGLTATQRATFTQLMYEDSADRSDMIELLTKYFYYDAGQSVAKTRLTQLIAADGTLNRLALQKLHDQIDASVYALPQQPGAIDPNMLAIIYCKNLGEGSVPGTSLSYTDAQGFYTVARPLSSTTCDSVGVTTQDRITYQAANFKTQRPVYYFQGSHDGATIAKGAIEHWQVVPQARSYFLLAQDGGHNPNLTRLRADARDLRAQEAMLFEKAILAQPMTQDDVDDVNVFNPAGQPWTLYLTKPKTPAAQSELNRHLDGIGLISLLLGSSAARAETAATPAPQPTPLATPIDWDHLPEGQLQDLLSQKEELSALDAAVMTQSISTISTKTNVPSFIIYAAVKQESDFQPYGILYDYGNYSCSISQFNISTFCEAFSKTEADRASVGWPDGLSCDNLSTLNAGIMYPFYMAAYAKHVIPQSGTLDSDFSAADPSVLVPKMPATTLPIQQKLFQAARSFGANCNHTEPALRVMANALKEIYDDSVPGELKKTHTAMAWLLADAMYNMGDTAVSLLKAYGGKDIWKNLTPKMYVDIFGKILANKPTTSNNLAYTDEDGKPASIGYFRICVSQRHVTSITNAGLPAGVPDVLPTFSDDCATLYPEP